MVLLDAFVQYGRRSLTDVRSGQPDSRRMDDRRRVISGRPDDIHALIADYGEVGDRNCRAANLDRPEENPRDQSPLTSKTNNGPPVRDTQ